VRGCYPLTDQQLATVSSDD